MSSSATPTSLRVVDTAKTVELTPDQVRRTNAVFLSGGARGQPDLCLHLWAVYTSLLRNIATIVDEGCRLQAVTCLADSYAILQHHFIQAKVAVQYNIETFTPLNRNYRSHVCHTLCRGCLMQLVHTSTTSPPAMLQSLSDPLCGARTTQYCSYSARLFRSPRRRSCQPPC